MPKADQIGMFDTTIEDPEIEQLLNEVLELEGPKTDYRTKKKEVRELIEKRYSDAINADARTAAGCASVVSASS